MYSEIVRVTPELANEYLKKSGGNRKLKRRRIEQYKAAMRDGKWQLTPDGPCFDVFGTLKNAHHRLTAVVESGVSVDMYVTFDVPAETTAYDIGDPRDAKQYLIYNEGMNQSVVNNDNLALARLHMYFLCGETRTLSDQKTFADLGKFIRDNDATLQIVRQLCGIKSDNMRIMRSAALGYAFFCALKCGVQVQTLNRFARTVATGFYDSESETAAIVIRNELLAQYHDRNRDIVGRAKYCKDAQAGIHDFCAEKQRSRPYRAKTAVYTEKYIAQLNQEQAK